MNEAERIKPDTHDPSSEKKIKLGVCLALTVGAVGIYKAIESLVSPALPIIQSELGASRAEVAWLMTGVLLTGPIVTPLISRLADIYDKRRLMITIMLIVALGTLVSSLSFSMQSLLIGQLLQGCGLSLVPLATGILKDTQSDGVLKFGNGMMISAIYGSTALGMLVAGPIADHFHYTYLFWMPFAALIILTAFAWFLLPSCPPAVRESRPKIDFFGAVLFAGSLAAFLIALTYAPTWGWTSRDFVALCIFSLALLTAFVFVELKHSEPLVELRILKDRRVVSAIVLMLVAGYSINSFFVSVPMQIQEPLSTGYGLGATATLTSFILVPGVLIGVLAPVVTLIERYVGLMAASIFGPLVMALGFFLAMQSSGSLPLVVASMLCAGFGSGVTITQAMNLVVTAVPSERISTFSGINFVVKAVGGTTGAQVVAGILSTDSAHALQSPQWSAFVSVFSLGIVACAVAALCAMFSGKASVSATSRTSSLNKAASSRA